MFSITRTSRGAILVLFCSVLSYAQSQPAQKAASEKQEQTVIFSLELLNAELEAGAYALDPANNRDKSGAASRVTSLHAKAVRDPALLNALISGIARDYSSIREGARSAPQVSQAVDEASIRLQFVIIQQNARIIALLEQMTRR